MTSSNLLEISLQLTYIYYLNNTLINCCEPTVNYTTLQTIRSKIEYEVSFQNNSHLEIDINSI